MSNKKWSTALLLLMGLCPMVFGWENPDGFAVSTATGNQSAPRSIPTGDSGAIITWSDYRGTTGCDVYAQQIDYLGAVQWTTNGIVIADGTGDQNQPQLTSDGRFGTYIIWTDFRNGVDKNLYLQRVDYGGNLVYPAGGKSICTESENQENAQIDSDGVYGAVMAWEDFRSGLGSDIYAQAISGVAEEDYLSFPSNGVPVCTANGNQMAPKIIADGQGGSIIVWEDDRDSFMTGKDIYAQALDANGNIRWESTGVPISTAGGDQSNIQIVSDRCGGALICWQSEVQYSDYTVIMIQAIDSTGQVKWDPNGIYIDQNYTYTSQLNPVLGKIGMMATKAFVVWEDYKNGNADIFAREVDNSESHFWTYGTVISVCTADYQQNTPQVTNDEMGNAVVTWTDYRSNEYSNIYAQKISWAGTAWADNGIALDPRNKDQYQAVPILDTFGKVIVVWTDSRNADNDIYAQGITETGFVPVELSEFSIE